jgi:basic amino acid/polyamine antiporter, APA family
VLGILCCLILMFSLPAENWLRLAVWLVVGLTIYFTYGRKHSRLAASQKFKPPIVEPTPASADLRTRG